MILNHSIRLYHRSNWWGSLKKVIHEKHPWVFRTSILTAADLTNGGLENRYTINKQTVTGRWNNNLVQNCSAQLNCWTMDVQRRKWSRDRKWSPDWTANYPRPQMIPRLDRKWSQDHKCSPTWTASDPAKKRGVAESFSDQKVKIPTKKPKTEKCFIHEELKPQKKVCK